MIDTEAFYLSLLNHRIDFFAGVPDSLLKEICACIQTKSPRNSNIIAANEGNAIAMACGYYLATGSFGMVYMQNSGEGNAVNPLLSLADKDVYQIPLLMLIGWRGEPGIHDEPQHIKQGKVTLPLLDAMGIRYTILGDDFENQLDECVAYMKETKQPIALVVRKGMFSKFNLLPEDNSFPLSREESLACILEALHADEFVVSTTGKASREIYELREKNRQGHDHDFLTVGSMGHTSSIAFGLAIGTDKDVYCVDGDGSFIMHMGAFPVIADKAPNNFHYILINNGAHESVGGQPTVALKMNSEQILLASGFKTVLSAASKTEIAEGIVFMRNHPLSTMVVYCHQGSRSDLGRPSTTPIENKNAFMKALSK